MSDEPAISVEGLVKSFGDVRALDGVDLEAAPGTVLGVLGPNGAGKTTTVRDPLHAPLPRRRHGPRGRARRRPRGHAAALPHRPRRPVRRRRREPHRPREPRRWSGASTASAAAPRRRARRELLERFGLDRRRPTASAKTYSGGMRRRLDLAAALVARPPVLFLDEPTTGLDPRSRVDLWETIEELVADGTTVLLTTQYLDEADRLADRIAVIDHGARDRRGHRRRAQGAASAASGSRSTSRDETEALEAAWALGGMTDGGAADRRALRARCRSKPGSGAIMEAVRRLDEAKLTVDDVAIRRPTLDDVFLALTGHAGRARSATEPESEVAA